MIKTEITTYLGIVKDSNGIEYYAKFHSLGDISAKDAEKLRKQAQKTLNKTALRKGEGVIELAGRKVVVQKDDGTKKEILKTSPIFKEISELEKVAIPNPGELVKPLEHPEHGKTTVSYVDADHSISKLEFPKRKQSATQVAPSLNQLIRDRVRELNEARGQKYDPTKKTTKESLIAMTSSSKETKDIQAKFVPSQKMKEHYNRHFPTHSDFTVTERIARNSPIRNMPYLDENNTQQKTPLSHASSYARTADEVHGLRGWVVEDNKLLHVLGRVDQKGPDSSKFEQLDIDERITSETYKAKTAVNVVFSGLSDDEFEALERDGEGNKILQIAVQSLVHTNVFDDQSAMLDDEISAYEKLAKLSQDQPLKIIGSDGITIHQVKLAPIPIATNQFDGVSRLEAILPRSLSGEKKARELSIQADEILFDFARGKLKDTTLTSLNKKLIEDTMFFLRECRSGKHSMIDELMLRMFLCDLLGIKMTAHCKSSIDRANVWGAIHLAMHQWRLGRGDDNIPKENGKYAIFKIVDEHIPGATTKEKIYPFKESVGSSLHRAQEMAKLARLSPKFKYGKFLLQHTALDKILPDRYFEHTTASVPKAFGSAVAVIFATLFWFLNFIYSILTEGFEDIQSRWHHIRDLSDFIMVRTINQQLLRTE